MRELRDNPFGASLEVIRTVLIADRYFSATEEMRIDRGRSRPEDDHHRSHHDELE